MKQSLVIFLLIFLTSACSQTGSTPLATQPAVNFPTISPELIPACTSADLASSSNFIESADEITLGLTLTNTARSNCNLSNPPQASLLDMKRQPLALPAQELAAAQTPPAAGLIPLRPDENIIFTLIWQEYCQPSESSTVILHLQLAEGQFMDTEINLQNMPACETRAEPGRLIIPPYSVPP